MKPGLADNSVHRTSNRRWKILACEHNKTFTEHEHEQTVQRSTVHRTSNTTFTSLVRTERRTQQHLRTQHRTEQRTSNKFQKNEHNHNNMSRANRTSNTTSLLCEQNIQHNTDFEQNIEQNNLDSNRTSNTTESQSRTQQCANTTPCEHHREHNNRIRTRHFVRRTHYPTSNSVSRTSNSVVNQS